MDQRHLYGNPPGQGKPLSLGVAAAPALTFTRPGNTTSYTAGDVIGSASSGNLELTNAGSAGALIVIQSASLRIDRASIPTGMTTLRLHMYDSQPDALADNAPFVASSADGGKYCGNIPLNGIAAIGGGFCWAQSDYVGRPIKLLTSSLWFRLVTDSAVTAAIASEPHTIRLHLIEVGR
jgi:hypothetical protein